MKENKYNLVYQNISCKSGNNDFPVELCKQLITGQPEERVSAFVFVEASEDSSGYSDFESYAKDEGYELYLSPYYQGTNQVLIGIDKAIKVTGHNCLGEVKNQKVTGRGMRENSVEPHEVMHPNYLRLTADLDGIPVDIIGARIPAYSYITNSDRISKKSYNCRLASFRQFLEALDRDLASYNGAILCIDSNNARHLSKFTDDYDPEVYKSFAQCNYNLPIVRSAIQERGLLLRETAKDYSFGPAHNDHCFSNIFSVRTSFFSLKGFDHSGIKVSF